MNNETQQPQDIQPTAENVSQAENIITPDMLNSLRTLKSIADKDFKTIENLVSIGGIKEQDGQILKNEVLKKMFSAVKSAKTQAQTISDESSKDVNQDKTAKFGETATNATSQNTTQNVENTSENEIISPNFATQNITQQTTNDVSNLGKSYPTAQIIDFLSKTQNGLPAESLKELVKIIENNAVQDYVNKENFSKMQAAQNEQAKQKLVSNVTSGKNSANGMNRIFTRESIKKMSPSEFKQYEDIIAKQIELGLLK